jgi:nucleotide-binding universal stress UspA family protein
MPLTVPPSWTLANGKRRNTVVLGYDRSVAARAALGEAARRSGPDGKLVVVYATSAPDALLDAAGYEEVTGAHDRYVQQIRDDVAATDLGSATVEVLLARKPVAETLVGIGQAFDADEIIVGLSKRGLLRSLIRRGVSTSVLKIGDRPVVVVPESIDGDETPTTR